ncbi:MAG: bifunctional protein-disulfide isomerase/oxidoreductase DsbC [Gammaproteobacteria bacterium]|nr:bifunctional protein-disulfide isomerase/oxidoreductase DsbC [Gammaproteobacteria bacterium]
MKKLKLLIASTLIVSLSFGAFADQKIATQLKTKLEAVLGDEVSSVIASEVNGFYEVMTPRGLFYASSDGRYIMQGTIYDLENGLKNITEQTMAKVRKDKMANYIDSMIVFKAKKPKHTITVFTDVDCGYCQRLHSKMAEYNDLGITVRYLAFPRGGPRSPAWGKMQSLWCSSDQHKAMDDLKVGSTIAKASCDNKVPEHYQLGIEFGVNGTPAIVLDDGSMIPGYQPPEQLIKILNNKA